MTPFNSSPTGTEPLNPETVFLLCNNAAAIGWIVLILTPRFPLFARLLIPVGLCGLLAVVYLYLVVSDFNEAEGSFTSLAGVAQLFANPNVVLAGWIHYLVFDLFVGCWEVRDSRRHGIHYLLVVPSLILTFLLGPIGLLIYFVLRLARTRSLNLASQATPQRIKDHLPEPHASKSN
ncbi:ABA4-like family protein [Rhodopirellula sp.]|nr:ABA4-like family protein [Rhodopirellula sp.]